jgi:hypothetical protein
VVDNLCYTTWQTFSLQNQIHGILLHSGLVLLSLNKISRFKWGALNRTNKKNDELKVGRLCAAIQMIQANTLLSWGYSINA